MSPEQRDGTSADARSDQYAFCLVVSEALGDQPSRQARAAIERGMSADPAARFASMDELLGALASNRRRRNLAVVAGAATLAIAAVIALAVRSPAVHPCAQVAA